MTLHNKFFTGILFAISIVGLVLVLIISSCGFPTTKEAGLRYATKPAFGVPANVEWEEVEFAKEVINTKEKIVYYGAGSNPVPIEEWKDFKVKFPWAKNIDRNILFTKTAFLRSPSAESDCNGSDCLVEKTYKGYSWVELAQPMAIDFIPSKTDIKKPAEGHLTVKVIKKCQVVVWENEIYELSDKKGNKYVMHATESGTPNLAVILPDGFQLKKIKIDTPLVVTPFGEKDECYFNIVGDHLGQGYHQYKYADDFFPNN